MRIFKRNHKQRPVMKVINNADRTIDHGGVLTLKNTAAADIIESHMSVYAETRSDLLRAKEDLEQQIDEMRSRLHATMVAITGVDAALAQLHTGSTALKQYRTRAQGAPKAEAPASGEEGDVELDSSELDLDDGLDKPLSPYAAG